MMATLVVGPFYLSRALGLGPAVIGIALAIGPLVAALTGLPAGRIVDHFGARRMTIAGLCGIAAGSIILSTTPAVFGLPGYIIPIVIVTASYALFQAANNTVIMTGVKAERRGVVSGMLSLSRNLGLITGASVMGALFAFGARSSDVMTARSELVASAMRNTFAVAAVLIVIALGIATVSRALSRRTVEVA
jgi:MFS family permease